jgi:hypothetical protein
MRAPFAPPRLSLPRKVDADAHAVLTREEIDNPKPDSGFQGGDVLCVNENVINLRNRMPDQGFLNGPR